MSLVAGLADMFHVLSAVITALFLNATASVQPSPIFSVAAPRGMVTGTVLLEAQAAKGDVAFVKWIVGDWAKTTGPPFRFSLDVGVVPRERRVQAVALDKDRRPLYQQEAVLNRGGRGLDVSFISPVAGQTVDGPTWVTLRVQPPADDPIDTVTVEHAGRQVPLERSQGLYQGVLNLPATALSLVAHVKTRRGRETELPLVLNTSGFLASSDVCAVEQMVGVYRGNHPVEGLKAADFSVNDDRGPCEIRSVVFVRDTPVAVGFVVDASTSLAHNRELLKAAASEFIDRCFRGGDVGFVSAFGPAVSAVQDWSTDPQTLKTAFQAVPEWDAPGTALYEAVVDAIYRFQGSQGARALVLLTDGYEFDGEMEESEALEYARHSGVKIYALALAPRVPRPGRPVTDLYDAPPNVAVLERFTGATGGKTYPVKKPENLDGVFREIERDLRAQYLVSYVSRAKRVNAFHPVTVKARHGEVHTAAGFFF